MQKRTVLGKGLNSLIKDTSNSALVQNYELDDKLREKFEADKPEKIKPVHGIQQVPVDMITANEYQPRKIFKDSELTELSESIKENGIIQPILVNEKDGKFELIAGERRYRAAKLAGLEFIPVITKNVTEKQKLELAIIENVQRSDLNCIEEALAYYQLMEDFQLTQDLVAKRIGKERSSIANFLRLLKLPRSVVNMLQKEEISFGHGKILAGIKDRNIMEKMAARILEEKLSVRALEEEISKIDKPKKEISNITNKKDWKDLQEKLEKRTGFHIKIKGKDNGPGKIEIKFNGSENFNDIFERLMNI